MIRLYLDEDFDQDVVAHLHCLGADTLTPQQRGKAGRGIPDSEVLAFATEEMRTVLTFNRRDFYVLHLSTRGKHCGIIACTRNRDVAKLAEAIMLKMSSVPTLVGPYLKVFRG